MGRRKEPDNSQFYQLIPRSEEVKPPDSPDITVTSDTRFATDDVEKWQKKLLKVYGYTTDRDDERMKLLYNKAKFIKSIPKDQKDDDIKWALKLLACDQSSLFLDDDSYYRSNRINGAVLSSRRVANRENDKYKYKFIDLALREYSSNPPPGAKILLKAIVEEAAEKCMSVRSWLYSGKHMDDAGQLDIGRCQEDCESLLSECGENRDIIEKLDFERFICLTVAFFAQREHNLKIMPPEASSYRDTSRDCVTVPALRQRLERLEALEEPFTIQVAPTAALYKMKSWIRLDQKQSEQTEQYISGACQKIQWFFHAMKECKKGNSSASTEGKKRGDFDYLSDYVRGVISFSQQHKELDTLKPIFLLNMVMACKYQLSRNSDGVPIPPNEMSAEESLFFPRISKPWQRYMQLMLLDELCKLFCLSEEDRCANLREYIGLYGKGILSHNELEFWNSYLDGKYELIPQIGFQLCFHAYCMQCIPFYPGHLNFRPCTALHLGGYLNFYRKNKQLLQTVSEEVCQKHRNEVYKYKVAWGKPRLRGKRLEEKLLELAEHVPLDLSVFQGSDRYDQEELKLLVLETIFQMQIGRDAIEVLLKDFSQVYEVPLGSAYSLHLKKDSAVSQGGFSVKDRTCPPRGR